MQIVSLNQKYCLCKELKVISTITGFENLQIQEESTVYTPMHQEYDDYVCMDQYENKSSIHPALLSSPTSAFTCESPLAIGSLRSLNEACFSLFPANANFS